MNLQKLTRFVCLVVLLIISSMQVNAQGPKITGKVIDQKTGKPLAGVSVKVKNSSQSTITNEEGVFTIKAPSALSIVTFSYVGYAIQEVKAGSSTPLNISLSEIANELNDVVVVGYGTQKRSHLTGSVGTIDMQSINDLPVGNLSEALKGQIVGVSTTGGFSRPGEAATTVIRNPLFFAKDGGASTEPIYVIDDVLRTKADFDLLDATEIESMSVLKDAAAAIYGIIGSNGVIIVKTRRGKAGQAVINYSASIGVSNAMGKPKMLNAYQEAQYFNASAGGQKDWDPTGMASVSTYYTPDELDYFKTINYNWLDEAFHSSFDMRHALNISGGSDKATYFAGLSYSRQNSNFDGFGYDKYSFRASSDIKLATGLKLGLSLSANLGEKKNTFSKIGGESLDNDWKSLVNQSPMYPSHIKGLPVWIPGSGTGSSFDTYNFFAINETGDYTSSKNTGINFQGNLSYEFPFLKGLKASVNYNRNIGVSWGKNYGTYYKTYSFNPLGGAKHYLGDSVINTYSFKNGDVVRINPTYTDVYQFNGTINYDKQIGKHQIGVLFGYEQSETYADGVAGQVEGVLVGGLDNQNFATGTQTSTEATSESGRLAYLGRLDYNYSGKYLVQIQFRADASLHFAPENRWGYFPSGSLGWVISEEGFFSKLKHTVNYLKLRGSVGFMGLDATKAWQWSRSYKIQTGKAAVYGGNAAMGNAVVADVELANRDVHWDNVNKYNIGLDTKFLNSRLTATIDGFLDHRYDMLQALTSSPSYLIGATLPTENFGSANNFGIEASVSWHDNISRDWSYGVTANFNWQDNKYLIYDVAAGDRGTFKDPVGKSDDMGYYGYKYLGMFRSQADIDAYVSKYNITKLRSYTVSQLRPGMLYYEDIRGAQDPVTHKYAGPDGIIDDNDKTYLNRHQNNHYGLGVNWNISYKSISLKVMMGLNWGGVNAVEGSARKMSKNAWTNRPAFWSDAWTPTNVNAKYPNPYFSDDYDIDSDFWWRSSTTFNINNFNLSYTLPKSVTGKLRFNSARLYLIGTNVLNILNPYDYKSTSSSYDAFPAERTFTFGLNVNL